MTTVLAIILIASLVLLVHAARVYRASARRWERHETARKAWLADPTNVDLYRKWLRS